MNTVAVALFVISIIAGFPDAPKWDDAAFDAMCKAANPRAQIQHHTRIIKGGGVILMEDPAVCMLPADPQDNEPKMGA